VALPVAVMVPTPPTLSTSSRYRSVPANTSKFSNRSAIAFMFSKSPELSFTPQTRPGNASRSRPISAWLNGTADIWGKWYR
jgi:hypothetical protein